MFPRRTCLRYIYMSIPRSRTHTCIHTACVNSSSLLREKEWVCLFHRGGGVGEESRPQLVRPDHTDGAVHARAALIVCVAVNQVFPRPFKQAPCRREITNNSSDNLTRRDGWHQGRQDQRHVRSPRGRRLRVQSQDPGCCGGHGRRWSMGAVLYLHRVLGEMAFWRLWVLLSAVGGGCGCCMGGGCGCCMARGDRLKCARIRSTGGDQAKHVPPWCATV